MAAWNASHNAVFDMFRGRYDGTHAYDHKQVQVETEHIKRVASLLNAVHRLKEPAVNTPEDADASAIGKELDQADATHQDTRKYLDQVGVAFAAFCCVSAIDYGLSQLSPH